MGKQLRTGHWSYAPCPGMPPSKPGDSGGAVWSARGFLGMHIAELTFTPADKMWLDLSPGPSNEPAPAARLPPF